MEWKELREVCDRYGIWVSYMPGEEQYRFYNWQSEAPFIKVYGYMPAENLSLMSPESLEELVVGYALHGMAS